MAMATAQADADDPESFSIRRWGETGLANLTPLWLLKYLPNMLACHVTIVHDCRGPSNTLTCAEVSGGLSLGESRRVIERGDADACFTGGAESRINPLGLYRQSRTGVMAETTGLADGTQVVRPFGTDAPGSVPGEAGCILLLESLDNAHARGARMYAEVIGFGAAQSCELSSGRIAPEAEGTSLRYAIERAIDDAGIAAEYIDAIVPMGMGAPEFDRSEANALRSVFRERLREIPLVTTKPNVGLCASAAGAIDIAVGALCVYHQMLPARINGDQVMDGVNAASAAERDHVLRHVLVCGSGLGGQCTAVILRRMS
jgi:3-oxoacyl-[acyl-carrier-protein] synthase II